MSDQLLQLVARRYASQCEIDKYVGRADAGLLPWEQTVEPRFLRPPGDLLDMGSGAGREAIALSDKGRKISATDINPEGHRPRTSCGRQGFAAAHPDSRRVEDQTQRGERHD